MNVEFLMAARERLIYRGVTSLAAALHDRPDDDSFMEGEEELWRIHRTNATLRPAADAVELMIARLVDAGANLPVTNPEAFQAAQWLSQVPLTQLPKPIPRPYVLYLARAYQLADVYETLSAALTAILNANNT